VPLFIAYGIRDIITSRVLKGAAVGHICADISLMQFLKGGKRILVNRRYKV